MDFSAYFTATAGASAALMGLLFVALQFNLEKRQADIRWRPIAQGTFNIFAILLVVSLFELIPIVQTYDGQRLLFILIPAIAIFRQIRTWLPVWGSHKMDRLLHTIWLMLIPVLLFGLMIFNVLNIQPSADAVAGVQSAEAVLLVFLFLTALRNSWQLVLEAGLTTPKP